MRRVEMVEENERSDAREGRWYGCEVWTGAFWKNEALRNRGQRIGSAGLWREKLDDGRAWEVDGGLERVLHGW
jgi:hypothetical protein